MFSTRAILRFSQAVQRRRVRVFHFLKAKRGKGSNLKRRRRQSRAFFPIRSLRLLSNLWKDRNVFDAANIDLRTALPYILERSEVFLKRIYIFSIRIDREFTQAKKAIFEK